jgi:twitching motility protein PilT
MTFNLRSLLEEMIQKDASDLHITAAERPKLRVDGDIVDSSVAEVLTPKDTLLLAYSVLTENQKKRFETEDELDSRSVFRTWPGSAVTSSSSAAVWPW